MLFRSFLAANPNHFLASVGIILVLAGVAFKIGAFPFQIWVPDVKARGFSAEIRRQIRGLDPAHETEVLDFIAAATEDRVR